MEAIARTDRPSPATVGRAIDVYLRCAYEGSAPARVTALVEEVRRSPAGRFYDSPLFERDKPDDASWYALRLGNDRYPHMKLVIEHLLSRDAWFFRADTHDSHVTVRPSDPDFQAFQSLSAYNRAVAVGIESAWTLAGLDTFLAFLRRDIDARQT